MIYLTLEDITMKYGKGQAGVEALAGVGFGVDQGEFVAVMGPSGSGKSTLLSVLGALNTPSQGRYLVDGLDIYNLNQDQRADFRREYLGFVFQNFNLVPYLSLVENVMLPLATTKLAGAAQLDLALQALGRVGLTGKERRLPSQVSGGEQERAAVARALVNRPSILLADEPTGNLDQRTSQEVMALLTDLSREGMTIVMVTHSPECASHASRLLSLCDGRVASDGQPPPRPAQNAACPVAGQPAVT